MSASTTTQKPVEIHIRRRANPDAPQYWEHFEVPYRPNLNIISCLMEIQKNPVNKSGERTTPPVWSMNCLEQVCGICTMIINGRARQSCSALVDKLDQPIKLEPMSKFPNIRDLVVDRSQMFDHLRRVHAWIELDGTHDLGPGPVQHPRSVLGHRHRLRRLPPPGAGRPCGPVSGSLAVHRVPDPPAPPRWPGPP